MVWIRKRSGDPWLKMDSFARASDHIRAAEGQQAKISKACVQNTTTTMRNHGRVRGQTAGTRPWFVSLADPDS